MKRLALPALLSLSIAACGGGGGDSIPPAPAASLKINSSNAVLASEAAYAAANQSAGIGDLAGSSGLVASTPGGSAAIAAGQFSKIGRAVTYNVPFGPEEQPCAMDGTITISGNLQNPFSLTENDYFTVVADRCDDGLGTVIHGTLDFTVVSFSGDLLGGLYELGMTLAMTDFQVTTADDALTSNGSATVTINTLNSPFVTAEVRGNSLTTDSNSGSETLSGFMSSQTLDAGQVPSPYTWTASGTLDTTALAGVVSYSTPVTFEGFDTDYPGTGELLLRGDGSTARLIAENSTDVTIEIDSDGDGEVDDTINTTWAELSN
ncbi:MAG: hypothetical protein QNJ07_04105 [Woeseiaceae bacterium]|nr:hypothetical protein [Woeseiaceae bacterium]